MISSSQLTEKQKEKSRISSSSPQTDHLTRTLMRGKIQQKIGRESFFRSPSKTLRIIIRYTATMFIALSNSNSEVWEIKQASFEQRKPITLLTK